MIELRVQQVIIDTPRLESVPFVAVVVQRIVFDKDGNITQTINRERMINKSFANIAMDIITYSDPVIQDTGKSSCMGIGRAIENIARSWVLEAYPESYLDKHRVLINDDNS